MILNNKTFSLNINSHKKIHRNIIWGTRQKCRHRQKIYKVLKKYNFKVQPLNK